MDSTVRSALWRLVHCSILAYFGDKLFALSAPSRVWWRLDRLFTVGLVLSVETYEEV